MALRSNSVLALREAAAAGLGLVPLPRWLGDADPRLRQAMPLPFTRELWLVVHRELRATAWVGWEAGSQMAFERWRMNNAPKARVGLRVTTVSGMRDAVDAGVGVSVFPCALGGTCPGWRCVRWIRDASTPLWILTHKDLRTTARVRLLRDFLADAIVKRRAIVEGRTG